MRTRKRALWVGTAVSWVIAGVTVTLSLEDAAAFHWRTLTLLTLTVAAMLFSTSVIASLIQAPDAAYRVGVDHGRAGTCDSCRPQLGTGTDGVVVQFPVQHTDN